MILVVDASVAIKWFLDFPDAEDHCRQALEILGRINDGSALMVQPAHFLAEMGTVLAREKPADAVADLSDLMAVEFQSAAEPRVYQTACEIAVHLKQHVFDTLYHAAALHTPGATLVTADKRYFRRARKLGHIAYLPDFVA